MTAQSLSTFPTSHSQAETIPGDRHRSAVAPTGNGDGQSPRSAADERT